MPDKNPQNFEHQALEADIEKLSQEIMEKRSSVEYKEISNRELVKQHLVPLIKNYPIGEIPVEKRFSVKPEAQEDQFLPDYLKEASPEIKLEVEKLLDEVLHKGLAKAVSEAKKQNALVLDAFHDALTDKLCEELKKRKIL